MWKSKPKEINYTHKEFEAGVKQLANNIAATAAYALFKKGDIDKKEVNKIYKDLGIDASKPNPWEV